MSKKIIEIRVEQIPDPDPDTSYLEQDEFADRLAEYQAGNFGFVGIRATAEIEVEGTIQRVSSPGLWGIEDDSDAAYLRDVGEEEKTQLADILRGLGFSKRAIKQAA